MKDHVEIGHLTSYDVFRVNRDKVMDLEIRFKIHTNISNFEKASPKNNINSHNYLSVCGNCKILSCTFYLKEDEMKIAMFAHFKEYHGNHKKF